MKHSRRGRGVPTNSGKPRVLLTVKGGYVPKPVEKILEEAGKRIYKWAKRYRMTHKDAMLFDLRVQESMGWHINEATMHLGGMMIGDRKPRKVTK